MSRRTQRWADTWLQSDLVSIPLLAVVVVVLAILVAIFLAIGNASGVFVDKLLFPIALGGLLIVFLYMIATRRARPSALTEGIQVAPPGSPRRILVVANRGLDNEELHQAVCGPDGQAAGEAWIVAPVAASSRLHALADDLDVEMKDAQARVDAAMAKLRSCGVACEGRVDVGQPIGVLLDGLREFAANEVVIQRGEEPHWEDAERLAGQIRAELGIRVTELRAPAPRP